MMRLRVHAFALTALLGGALAAPPVSHADPVTVSWFMWSGSQAEVDAWHHLCDLVHQKYPDITVSFQTASWPDYWTKLPALAAANQLPDIVSLQSMRTPGFAELLDSLNDRIKQDKFDIGAFDKTIVDGLSLQGQLYAVPYDVAVLVMYYNRDAFDAAKLPPPAPGWTKADYLRDAKALTAGGRYGTAVSVPDAFFATATSDGAPYLTGDGKLDLTNAKLAASFQNYTNLVSAEKLAPLLPSSGTPSISQATGRFLGGTVAMYIDGPWDLINIRDSAHFKVGIAPLPAGDAGSVSLVAGSGFGIATTSQHKDAAWKVIQVLTSPEAEQYVSTTGRGLSARTAQQRPWFDVAAKGVENAEPAIETAFKTAKPYRTTANWNTVSSLFEQYGPIAFGGEQPASQVLSTISQQAAE